MPRKESTPRKSGYTCHATTNDDEFTAHAAWRATNPGARGTRNSEGWAQLDTALYLPAGVRAKMRRTRRVSAAIIAAFLVVLAFGTCLRGQSTRKIGLLSARYSELIYAELRSYPTWPMP